LYGAFAGAYDRLMDDVDYAAWYGNVRQMLALAGLTGAFSVADVCCGTGQFAIRFAKEGCKTTGIDLSQDMLNVAADRARAAGVRMPFVHMDATRLELPRPVDVITCLCDGVNYMNSPEAARAFFTRAAALLRPGGALLFDVSTEHKFLTALDGRAFGEDLEDLCYLWTNSYDPQTRLCRMDLSLFFRGEDGRYDRAFETHVQRAHALGEVRAWLQEAGFPFIHFFSEMTIQEHRSEDMRVHVLATKEEYLCT
jgi:ubiquinone/menaquinone biosynthesis C-methylase UbiE